MTAGSRQSCFSSCRRGNLEADPQCPSSGSLACSLEESKSIARGFRDVAALCIEVEEAPVGRPGSKNLPHLSPWAKLSVSNPALTSALPLANAQHPGRFPRKQLRWPERRNHSFQRLKYISLIRITKSRGKKEASNNSVL